eukprot:403333104
MEKKRGRPSGSKSKKTIQKEAEEKARLEKLQKENGGVDVSNIPQPASAQPAKRGRKPNHHTYQHYNNPNQSNVNTSLGNPQKPLSDPSKKYYKSNQVHVYTELAKTSLGNTELFNIYGIVIDATSPHIKLGEMNAARQFKTHLKIIDPTVYPRVNNRDSSIKDDVNCAIAITIFHKNPEYLPTFKRVGDIVRIHRCNIGYFKERKTFSVIIPFGSSWVTFEGREKKEIFEDQQNQKSPKNLEDSKDIDGDQIMDSDSDDESKKKKKQLSGQKHEQRIKNFFGLGENKQQPSNKIEITAKTKEDLLSQQSLVGEDQEVMPHYLPMKISSKEYSMGLVDRDIIRKLRKWGNEYFKNEFLYENNMVMTLSKARDIISNELISGQRNELAAKGFDLIVQIEQINNLEVLQNGDQKVLIKISDHSCGDFDLFTVQSLLPKNLKKGDAIRIKAAIPSQTEKKKNALETKDSSNIMLIDPSFKQAQYFNQSIDNLEVDMTPMILGEVQQHHHNEYSHLYQIYEEVLEKPEIASTIGQLYIGYEATDLADILYQNPSLTGTQQEQLYRVQCYVLNIQPLNLLEISQVYCNICYSNYSYKQFPGGLSDVSNLHCPNCQNGNMQAIYMIQFLVKDKSLYHLNGAMKMILYTMDEVCNKFFNGIEPCNLYREQLARQQIEKYMRHLVRFNVYLDVIVERKCAQGEVVLKLVNCKLNKQF